MRRKLATANKALAAALAGAAAAVAPQVIEALNAWVAAAIGAVLAGIATWAAPKNRPTKDG